MSSPSCSPQGRQPGRNLTLFAERILIFWRWCRYTGDGLILACRGITALGDLGSNTAVLFPKLFLFPFLLALGEADGQGWHYCSSRCIHPCWARMASPRASEKQPETGERQKAKKNQQQNLEVYCCNAEAEQVVLGTALACP